MCQSKLIVIGDDKADVIMTDVVMLENRDGTIRARNLLGKEIVLEGYKIDYVDFISHKAYLRRD